MTTANLWTLLLALMTAIGAGFSWYDVRARWHDWTRFQQSRRQSELQAATAYGNLRTAILTLGMYACVCVAMSVALFLEPGDAVRLVVGRIGVFGAMLLLTAKRVYDWSDRRHIRSVQRQDAIDVVPGSDLDVLGGPTAIDQIVAGIYARLLRDELLKHHFRGIQVSRLILSQADWLTRRLAGKASSIDLADAHAHLRISTAEFDRFLEIFRETLSDFKVPPDLSAQLASIMSAERDMIVAREPRP
jgi:hemoglobin